jgi:hypothetical protein
MSHPVLLLLKKMNSKLHMDSTWHDYNLSYPPRLLLSNPSWFPYSFPDKKIITVVCGKLQLDLGTQNVLVLSCELGINPVYSGLDKVTFVLSIL